MSGARPGPRRRVQLSLSPALLMLLTLLFACSDGGAGFARLRAPTDVDAQAVPGGVLVTWTDASEGEDGQRVYRRAVSLGGASETEPTVVGTTGPDEESFLDETGDEAVAYAYSVAAFKGGRESAAAPQVGLGVVPTSCAEPVRILPQ